MLHRFSFVQPHQVPPETRFVFESTKHTNFISGSASIARMKPYRTYQTSAYHITLIAVWRS